jgi:hypothetical protein
MQSVEIRYAGVVVGQAREVRRRAGDETGLFLVVADPLPVGTAVELGLSAPTPARVVEVVESADPAQAGMYLRLLVSAEEVLARGLPPAPGAPVTNGVHANAAPVPAPTESLTPVIEVIATPPQVVSPVPTVVDDAGPTTAVHVTPAVIAATAVDLEAASEPSASPGDLDESPDPRATAAYGAVTDAGPSDSSDMPKAKPLPPPDNRRRTTKRRRK